MAVNASRALAMARGWTSAAGLPDETKAGRQLLKDYVNGKLVYCTLPPCSDPPGIAPLNADASTTSSSAAAAAAARSSTAADMTPAMAQSVLESDAGQHLSSSSLQTGPSAAASQSDAGAATQSSAAPANEDVSTATFAFDAADLELLESLRLEGSSAKARRPDYKFHKKAARSKGSRGQVKNDGVYDGAALTTGKKGGLVRVSNY